MAMVLVQVAYAGLNVLFKLAVEDGMNLRILVAYRLLFATVFILPLALIFERKKRPKLTWKVLVLSFLSGLLGASLVNNLYIWSLSLTSAIFATAGGCTIPGLTFITAVLFRLEKLRLRSKAGQAKLVGTIFGVGGAFVFTLYKGGEINMWSTHVNLLGHVDKRQSGSHVAQSNRGPILGAVIAFASYLSITFWLLLQAKTSKEIEGHYWNNFLTNLMGTIQSMGYALCTQRNWREWRLGWNIRLLTAAYSGIAISGLSFVVMTWCAQLRGPLFVSIFSPLSLVIVALVASLTLDENLYVGSIIGTVLIVGGLYMVLWGKSEETKKMMIPLMSPSSIQESEVTTRKSNSTPGACDYQTFKYGR